MTENNNDSKDSVWTDGSLDELEYVGFNEKNNFTVKVKFLESEPEMKPNQFGTPAYGFQVFDQDSMTVRMFTITSKRLMRELQTHLPIEGKAFIIHRTGAGMDTDYQVEPVKA